VVATRGDTYLAGSLFEMFRLLRVSFIEAGGCREIVKLLRNALILREIQAHTADNA